MPNLAYRGGQGRAKYRADCDKIVEYCRNIENRVDHTTRIGLHRLDEKIWRLEKYTLEELQAVGGKAGDARLWPSFTSNGPRTYWQALRRAITANSPRFRIQIPGMIDEDEDDAELYAAQMMEIDRHEHFSVGLWNSVDEQRIRRAQLPFQDQLAWFMSLRGGVFIRPWFESEKRYPFQVPMWDPMTVAYDVCEDGLEYVCHHYRTPLGTVKARYDVDESDHKLATDEEGNIEIYDAWWLEYVKGEPHIWNAVACGDGYPLLEAYEYRDLDHIPVYLVRTFGPDVENSEDYRQVGYQTQAAWETIYTANRDVYPWINRVLTLNALYLRQHAIGPWLAKDTGFNAEQLRNALQPFQIIQTRNPNASIQPVSPPEMAGEVKELFNWLTGAEQRGSVPYSIFGQIPFELSGFAVNQLQGAVSIQAGQLAKMMGWVYRLATDELIQQFRQRGKKVTIAGFDQRRRQFIEDIKRAELRDKYHLEVDMSPELPSDKLQQAQVAQLLSGVGIDPITILDEVLKVASPREIMKRIIAWQTLQTEMKQQGEMEQMEKAEEEGGGMPPQILPPEAQGLLAQHAQFAPSPQHIPFEALAAAGFAGE